MERGLPLIERIKNGLKLTTSIDFHTSIKNACIFLIRFFYPLNQLNQRSIL
jgi:hypothetical protein